MDLAVGTLYLFFLSVFLTHTDLFFDVLFFAALFIMSRYSICTITLYDHGIYLIAHTALYDSYLFKKNAFTLIRHNTIRDFHELFGVW